MKKQLLLITLLVLLLSSVKIQGQNYLTPPYTGATPYSAFYGGNPACNGSGCSEIRIQAPTDSDVLVTIKKGGVVVRHAYIRANSSFTFQMPNGIYQPFFYYGKGWNSNKEMKHTARGILRGGFTSHESYGKDTPQTLQNNVLTYRLILSTNGNFSQRPSSANEAL